MPDIIANIFFKVMEYPWANFYTIRSLNVDTTNIFQFLTIFEQNLAILPPQRAMTHFLEVYQTFSHFWNIIKTNHGSRSLSSENEMQGIFWRFK